MSRIEKVSKAMADTAKAIMKAKDKNTQDSLYEQLKLNKFKFRGFSPKMQNWVYGFYIEIGNYSYILPMDLKDYVSKVDGPDYPFVCMANFFEVVSESVGQYTGLKDKKGKEIYEWDIIKNNRGFIYVVFWNENACGFFQQLVDSANSARDARDMRWNLKEVIGNKFENPELLEGKK